MQDGEVGYCLLNAYQQTQDPKYLSLVKTVIDNYIHYWHAYTTNVDPTCIDCGYFYYSTNTQGFGHFVKNTNMWMGSVTAELAAITGNSSYQMIATQVLHSEEWEVNVKHNFGYLGQDDPSNHSHYMDPHMIPEIWRFTLVAKYLQLTRDSAFLTALSALNTSYIACGSLCHYTTDQPLEYCSIAPYNQIGHNRCQQYILSTSSADTPYPIIGVVEAYL